MLREMRKQYGWMPDDKLMDERCKEDAAYNNFYNPGDVAFFTKKLNSAMNQLQRKY